MKRFNAAVSWRNTDFTYPGLMLLLYFFLVLFAPVTGFHGDKLWWTDWCTMILNNGMGKLYEGNIDYPPFYPLFLYLYVKVQGSTAEIVNNLHYLKAFTLIFDFAGALLAISFVEKSERKWLLPLFVLFNPAYLYNTYIWNQVDAIFSTLCLGAAVLAIRQKVAWSMLLFLVALNTKLQSIMFLPPLVLLWLSGTTRNFSWKGLGLGLLLLLGAQYLILAPYDAAAMFDKVIVTAVGRYPYVSVNAFNFWHLVSNEILVVLKDDTPWHWGISYKSWGFLLFFIASFFILLPLLQYAWQYFRRKIETIPPDLVFLTMGMIALTFFFFLTEMHERYSHPALILFYAYGFTRKRYLLVVLVSFAYFLNLEKIMQYLSLETYGTLIFEPKFIGSLFAIAFVVGMSQLYRTYVIK